LVRSVIPALHLGDTSENAVVLVDHWTRHFHQQMAREQCERPTVSQLREWMERPRPMGLPGELQDLVILVFAATTNRHFTLNGGPYAPDIGKLIDAAELREEQLPSAQDWQIARDRASELFGLVPPSVLNSANVATLAKIVREAVGAKRAAVLALLEEWQGSVAEFAAGRKSARLRSAQSAQALLAGMAQAEDGKLIERLARESLETSPAAVSRLLGSCDALLRATQQAPWGVFRSLGGIQDQRKAAADEVLAELAEVLSHDEHVRPLDAALRDLNLRALGVLAASGGTPAPAPNVQVPPVADSVAPTVPLPEQSNSVEIVDEGLRPALTSSEAQQLLDSLRGKLIGHDDLQLSLSWRLERHRKG